MLQLVASARPSSAGVADKRSTTHYFIIAIAAHNEEAVIANTVHQLSELDYPPNLYSVHVVADHCSDHTAEAARRAGAVVHERNEGPRTGKGSALSWLFEHILNDLRCDAVVIFDADTRVDEYFLRAMDARLSRGDQIVQGQHIISNPDDGWFPALTWSMFLIDNRLQNLGRSNLGLSAKNMGDSICFRVDLLREVGWTDGLADDYQLRQRCLLNGTKITYEPAAIGFGQAPATWTQARAQRTRWIRGVYDANRLFARQLLVKGARRRDAAMLDGALQAVLPSYSTLTGLTATILLIHVIGLVLFGLRVPQFLILGWAGALLSLFLIPLVSLAYERAPAKAYLMILTGPVFIVWRIWLALVSRLTRGKITWVRTTHKV